MLDEVILSDKHPKGRYLILCFSTIMCKYLKNSLPHHMRNRFVMSLTSVTIVLLIQPLSLQVLLSRIHVVTWMMCHPEFVLPCVRSSKISQTSLVGPIRVKIGLLSKSKKKSLNRCRKKLLITRFKCINPNKFQLDLNPRVGSIVFLEISTPPSVHPLRGSASLMLHHLVSSSDTNCNDPSFLLI